MSKEEIEEYKETLEELASDENVYNSIKKAVGGTFKYIEQLENKLKKSEERDKKLIDKLENDKFTIESTYSQTNGNYFMAQDRLDLINEILAIVKGENDE